MTEPTPNYADLKKPAEKFLLEVVIDGVNYKAPIQQFNKESVTALMEIATSLYMPRISGWNLYSDTGALLVSCPIAAFINEFVKQTPLKSAPADPKSGGWRALPIVTGLSQEFQEMMAKAKKDGNIPT